MKSAILPVILSVIFSVASFAQEEKAPENTRVSAEEEGAQILYDELGTKFDSAAERAPNGHINHLTYLAVIAENGTIFDDADRQSLDEAGRLFVLFWMYYQEATVLMPPGSDSKTLLAIFADTPKLARLRKIADESERISTVFAEKFSALMNKVPSSARMIKWRAGALAEYADGQEADKPDLAEEADATPQPKEAEKK